MTGQLSLTHCPSECHHFIEYQLLNSIHLSSKRNLDKEFLPSASAELPVREMLQYSLDEAKESAKLEIPSHVSFLAPTPIHSDTQPTKSCSFSNQNSTREEYHSVFPMSVKRKPLYTKIKEVSLLITDCLSFEIHFMVLSVHFQSLKRRAITRHSGL